MKKKEPDEWSAALIAAAMDEPTPLDALIEYSLAHRCVLCGIMGSPGIRTPSGAYVCDDCVAAAPGPGDTRH